MYLDETHLNKKKSRDGWRFLEEKVRFQLK